MKRALLITFSMCLSLFALAQTDTLFLSTTQVVHLRFSSELKYVNLGNKVLIARIVDGSKDFVAVKAKEPFDYCTSLSCLETNGQMHTFIVAYQEYPERLEIDTRHKVSPLLSEPSIAGTAVQRSDSAPSENQGTSSQQPQADFLFSSLSIQDIMKMKRGLYHIGTKNYNLEILCEEIFICSDVLFLVMTIDNKSSTSYDLSSPRFAIENKRNTKRTLQYEKALFPNRIYGLGPIPPGSKVKVVFSFDKLSLHKDQILRVYFYENLGSRNFEITINSQDINKARLIKEEFGQAKPDRTRKQGVKNKKRS